MFRTRRADRSQYALLEVEKSPFRQRAHQYWTGTLSFWREAVIIGLCLFCALLTLERSFRPLPASFRSPAPKYHLTSEDVRWRQFRWQSHIYSSEQPQDAKAINDAWEQIVPAHGIVAVDHEWAAEHDLPSSMSLPSDRSKGVYIIDAYHQIHCLTVIRKTFKELELGQPLSKGLGHSLHCFDSLLQYITCGTPGDTLLYTWGRNVTGDGQLRRCVDWQSRKQWAKANTACYKDGDHPIPLYEHFDHCENDDDGILGLEW